MKMIVLQMFCSSGKLKNLEKKTIPVENGSQFTVKNILKFSLT